MRFSAFREKLFVGIGGVFIDYLVHTFLRFQEKLFVGTGGAKHILNLDTFLLSLHQELHISIEQIDCILVGVHLGQTALGILQAPGGSQREKTYQATATHQTNRAAYYNLQHYRKALYNISTPAVNRHTDVMIFSVFITPPAFFLKLRPL